MLDETIKKSILVFQKNEITEYFIYGLLSRHEKSKQNQSVLHKIAEEELSHYQVWKKYTGIELSPDRLKIAWYYVIAKLFGVTFATKLMEAGEKGAQKVYGQLVRTVPEAEKIMHDEEGHENELISMIDEEKLKYIGSVVLGLNDALVELTGTLAGLTFALQNSKLVGVAGLITGIAASLSMAASEYLSTKTEAGEKNPLRASFYTGVTYVLAVAILIAPFLILSNHFVSLAISLLSAILMIWVFTFYFSVVREVSFRRRFVEMVGICLGVASLSFILGLAVRQFLGITI